MKRFPLWCAAALLPLLAACSFSVIPKTGYTETRTFDLSSPAPFGELPFIVEVESFSNECSGRYKMVVREDPNRIDVDEYNRWAMPPGAMLTKYLAARFAVPPDNHLSQSEKPVFDPGADLDILLRVLEFEHLQTGPERRPFDKAHFSIIIDLREFFCRHIVADRLIHSGYLSPVGHQFDRSGHPTSPPFYSGDTPRSPQ